METLKLNNGVEIPSIGLGVWKMDDATLAYKAIRFALDLGYRHIDTAMIYKNEEVVGKAIKDSGIAREEIFLTTKLWNDDQRSGKVTEAINASLKKLNTEYVDLYLVHWPVKETYISVWEKMEKVYQDGKTKAIGVSNYQPYHLDELLQKTEIVPSVNQIECYPYLSQEAVITYCKGKGIHPEAWGPLGAGKTDILTNPIMQGIAKNHNKSTAQVALRWNLQRGVIIIPKSVHENRLSENFSIADFSLTAEEMKQINRLDKNMRLGPHPDNFDF